MFWFYALLMILLALFIILFGARRQHQVVPADRKELMLAVYRQQFADLDMDLNNGVVTEEQAALTRLELEHALLAEMETKAATDTVKESSASPDWLLNGCIVVLLPVLATGLYYKLGQPDLGAASATSPPIATGQGAGEKLPSIEELLAGLEQRLQQTPDDEKGLWMLTRTYMALGRYADALGRVEHLYSLAGDDPAISLLYANVLMLNNNESFAGKPVELIHKALALEPDNVSGLWLAGLAAREQGDTESAVRYWQKVLPLVADDDSAVEQLQQLLAEAGATGKTTAAADSVIKGVPAAINVDVSLSQKLQAEVAAGDTLFVFAKAIDGTPMPLAVSRLSAAQLPSTVVLNDAMAMMPALRLSGFDEVQVSARISKSGNAIAQAGDLASESQTVKVGASVSLIIDRVVK